MQANEFEKNIQASMESFSIKPNDAVWNNVAIRIAKKEKRRRAIFWLFSTALLCGAFGLWILSGENKNNSFKNEETTIAKKSDTINVASQQKPNAEISDKESVAKTENSNLPLSVQTIRKNEFIKNKNSNAESKAHQLDEKKKLSKYKLVLNNSNEKQQKIVQAPLVNKVARDNKSEKALVEYNLNQEINSKIEIENLAKANKISNTDSIGTTQKYTVNKTVDTVLVSNKGIITQPVQKSKWKSGITIIAGISDILQPGSGDNNYANESLSVPPGLSYYNSETPLQYFTSYSFGIGGFISKPINKKFELSIGINYHFYQASSRVGNRESRNANYFDSTFLQNTTLNNYYSYGDVAWYNNNYHLLQMPFLFSYKMNKNESKGIKITGGILPGYLFGSKAIFDNKSRRIFYENNDQFHRINLSVNAGMLWSWKNKNGNKIEVGPVLQYQINNLVKPIVSNKQHLFFTGIKTNFFFK